MHRFAVGCLFTALVLGCATPAPTARSPEPAPPAPAATAPALAGIEVDDLDRSASPCEDFFQFANGAWRAKNPIPASMARWSRRWAAGELAKDRLKGILDEVSARTDWPAGSVEQQIGDFYAGCMDQPAIDAAGLTPLEPHLAAIAAMRTPADVMRVVARLHQLGVGVPFSFQAIPDLHDPTVVVANLGSGGLGLPDRDYYFKPEPRFVEARQKYREHLVAMFRLAGRDERRARAAADQVFELETRLARATLDVVAQRNPRNLDHPLTVAELKARAPRYDWAGFFTAVGVSVEKLNVSEPAFAEAVSAQLTATPVEGWRSYLTWHLLSSAAPFLPAAFAEEDFRFHGAYLDGAKEMKPRWKRCAEATDQLLGEALGQKYVEKYFPPRAKARMQELVKNVLLAMGDSIRGLTWMSDDTRKKALEKLSTFNPKVGYPDTWKDYSSVTVSRGAAWASAESARRFAVRDELGQVGKPVDRGRWGMTPPTSNAYYNPLLNEIVFPAGILQPPAFSVDASDAVNYGAIGVVIGHEVSHGFDDQGAQFDATGRLENWWTEQDLAEFTRRGQCVVEQFDGYAIEPGIHHNGKLVLGESIGDLAGARIAYMAFQRAMAGQPRDTVDGFTPEQQFFIAWGQFRGDEIRPEAQRLMVQNDPHPTGKYRVVGPLSNLPEFARAFSCPAGSPMVRAARCEIW